MRVKLDQITDELRTESLLRLRGLETRTQPLPQIFQATLDIIVALRDFDRKYRHMHGQKIDDAFGQCNVRDSLDNMEGQVKSFERNAQYLLQRLQCTAQMFTDGLALKGQKAAQQQNDHLFELAKLSQIQTEALCKDSATIRVITFATLVFLPSTFVSVSGQGSEPY
jgi:hypothetical protein